MSATPPFLIIAIDGGAASGKSSTARALSNRFRLLHVDTGSYYRAIAFQLLQVGLQPGDEAGVGAALQHLPLGTRVVGSSARLEIGDWTPGEEIRSPAVNEAVSRFAALPAVRSYLLAYQRRQAEVARAHAFCGLVMEGRDIGSVIFPDADLRIFLHASAEARAGRRAAQGQVDSILERDKLDTSRKTSPLVCPPGALPIDTTLLSLEAVVEHISGLIRARGLQG